MSNKMQIDEFLELVRTRRSIRKLKPDPVPDELIQKILEAARWSMSGANGQPWEFIVVKKQENKTKLAELYRNKAEITWAYEMTRLEEYRQPRFRSLPGTTDQQAGFIRDRLAEWEHAPVLIVVVGDRRTAFCSTLAGRLFESHVFDKNMGNACQMICLAAAACGLGTQWATVWENYDDEFKRFLEIPTALCVSVIIPVGYPAISPKSYRRELSEMVHYEKYDASKARSVHDVLNFVKFQRRKHTEGKTYNIEDIKK